jgi:hypothetical protein
MMAAGIRGVVQTYHAEQDALRQLTQARLSVVAQTKRPRWVPSFIDAQYARFFDRVTVLDLSGQSIDEDRGYWLSPENFTDEHVFLVMNFRRLERLNVGSTRITPKSLTEFAQLEHLKALNVSGGQGDWDRAISQFRKRNPDCLICRRYQLVEASLHADGSVVIDGEQRPLRDALQLLRSATLGPAAFGYSKGILLYIDVDAELVGEQRQEAIERLTVMATKSGYGAVQIAPQLRGLR